MSEKRETLVQVRSIRLDRVDESFAGAHTGKHYEVVIGPAGAVRFEKFLEAWSAYLDAVGYVYPTDDRRTK